MGISVIPSAAGNLAAASTSPSATSSTDTAPGGFAALLSGGMKAMLSTPQALGAKNSSTQDKAITSSQTDNPAPSDGAIDPALIASLLGSPAVPTQLPTGNAATPAASDPSADFLAGRVSPDQGGAALLSSQLGLDRRTSGTADKAAKSLLATDGSQPLPQTEGAAQSTATSQTTGMLNTPPPATLGKDSPPAFSIPSNETPLRTEAANIAGDAQIATMNGPGASATPALSEQAAANAPQSPVAAHLQDAAWPQQFGDKIVWMARNDQQSAQISIHPPQLGPIQVTLNLNGDQASLAFSSPHAEVRQAIESAMPQLQSMLSSAGINLGQANVGANMGQQNQAQTFQSANGNRSADENAILPANDKVASVGTTPALLRGRGLVDLFA